MTDYMQEGFLLEDTKALLDRAGVRAQRVSRTDPQTADIIRELCARLIEDEKYLSESLSAVIELMNQQRKMNKKLDMYKQLLKAKVKFRES